MVVSTKTQSRLTTIIAEVPLAETFGYSTHLRSMTQGQGSFSMELHKYSPVPSNIQAEIVEERKKRCRTLLLTRRVLLANESKPSSFITAGLFAFGLPVRYIGWFLLDEGHAPSRIIFSVFNHQEKSCNASIVSP